VIRRLSLAFALFVLVDFGRPRMLAVESHPSIEVYLPPPDKATGAGVVVVPAGVAKGGHGFNMAQRSNLTSVHTWPQRLADWLRDSGILGAPQ
jgi:hypothetical protein